LVLQLTNSPLMLGLTGLTHSIPTIVLTLVGGVVADLTDRRRIMILIQGSMSVLFFVLATLVLTGKISMWHVLLFAFLSGCLRAFDRPSRYAILPQMVPREEIANAVALGSSIWQICRLVGPGVAGMLIYFFGVGETFYVCSLGSLSALILWFLINLDRQAFGESKMGLMRYMLGGLNFIRSNEIFYTLIGMTFFNSVFGMSYVILMPIFARDILHVGSWGFGFLQSALVGPISLICFIGYLALPTTTERPVWNQKAFLPFAVAGLFETLGVLLMLIAFATGPVVIVSPITATAPIWTLLMAVIFLRDLERISASTVIGTLCVVAGVIAISMVE